MSECTHSRTTLSLFLKFHFFGPLRGKSFFIYKSGVHLSVRNSETVEIVESSNLINVRFLFFFLDAASEKKH